jgi:hypothetical protein
MALEVTTVAQGRDVDIDLMDLVVSRPRFLAAAGHVPVPKWKE